MIQDVIDHQLFGFFTDGHARNALTKFYPTTDLPRLNDIISHDKVYEEQWGETFDNTGEAKRAKSAELLLKEDVPPAFIKWFVVYDEKAKDTLTRFGIAPEKTYIRKNFYF